MGQQTAGVHLISRGGKAYKMRDGIGPDAPVFSVGDEPVFFRTLMPSAFRYDNCVDVVTGMAALSAKDYDAQVIRHKEIIAEEKGVKAALQAEINAAGGPAAQGGFVEAEDDEDDGETELTSKNVSPFKNKAPARTRK